jgi:hypothetical protein
MSAAPKHILKYTALYQTHYPTSSILLVTNSVPDLFYPSYLHAQRLIPAILAIESSLRVAIESNTPPKVLLHCFSNGGSNVATQLAASYYQKTGQPLPIRAMIIDSAPGTARFRSGVRAMAYSLPPGPVIRLLGTFLIWIFVILYAIFHEITRLENAITIIRRNLISKHFFNSSAARCYLYSKADELVAWQDVEEHADEAEAEGWSVSRTVFEDTPHAGHIRGSENERKYWAAVDLTWKRREME